MYREETTELLVRPPLSSPGASSEAPPLLIEFLTAPNNPDGDMRLLPGHPNARPVHDMACNWPSSAPNMTRAADVEVALFSLGTLSGHTGTRFGWALVRNRTLADLMSRFVENAQTQIGAEGKARASAVIGAILDSLGDPRPDFFGFIRARLDSRRTEVLQALGGHLNDDGSSQGRVRVEVLDTGGCGFYIWLRCVGLGGVDSSCSRFFGSAGVAVAGGASFGMPPDFARLELVQREASFQLMLQKIRNISAASRTEGSEFGYLRGTMNPAGALGPGSEDQPELPDLREKAPTLARLLV